MLTDTQKRTFKTVMLTLVCAFAAATLILTCAPNAEASPLGTSVTYVVDYDDDLPMYDGDLDSIVFWAGPADSYWLQGSDIGPCAYNVYLDGTFQVVVDALGGELLEFDEHTIHNGPHVGTGPATISSGVLTLTDSGTATRTITDDTRCNYFEGTGTIDLSWAAKRVFTVQGTGCNFGPQTLQSQATGNYMFVTYYPK